MFRLIAGNSSLIAIFDGTFQYGYSITSVILLDRVLVGVDLLPPITFDSNTGFPFSYKSNVAEGIFTTITCLFCLMQLNHLITFNILVNSSTLDLIGTFIAFIVAVDSFPSVTKLNRSCAFFIFSFNIAPVNIVLSESVNPNW